MAPCYCRCEDRQVVRPPPSICRQTGNDVSWMPWKRGGFFFGGAFERKMPFSFVSFLLGMQKKRTEGEERSTVTRFVFQQHLATTAENNPEKTQQNTTTFTSYIPPHNPFKIKPITLKMTHAANKNCTTKHNNSQQLLLSVIARRLCDEVISRPHERALIS